MSKTHEVKNDGEHYAWSVWCPACDQPHTFHGWTFDGNHEAPTFSPSMLVKWRDADLRVQETCHSFLRAGVWEFLDDCTHAMRGQKVPAPDWPRPNWGIPAPTRT